MEPFDGNGNPGAEEAAPLSFDPENRLAYDGSRANAAPVAVAQGGDGLTRILWRNANASCSLWTVQSNGTAVLEKSFGPYPGWTATAVAAAPTTSTTTRILWNHSDGTCALWSVDSSGNFSATNYGPYPGWVAKSLAIGPDNLVHILWNHWSDGQMSLWNIAASGSYTSTNYGPFAGWSANDIAVGANNIVHVLWMNANGTSSLWNIDGSGTSGYSTFNDGPYPGWNARTLSVGPASDPTLHVLWVRSDGTASVRILTTTGSVVSYSSFGPFPGDVALGCAVGQDDLGHLLWTNANGSAYLWNVSANNTQYTALPTFNPGNNGDTWTAAYRGDGLRAYKNGFFGQFYYLYDGTQPVCEFNSHGQVMATNTFGAAGIISRYPTSAYPYSAFDTFYTFDERGNVSERWNAHGGSSASSSDIYDAYGAIPDPPAGNDPWNYRAQSGYYTDTETGLSLLTNRYYDPGAGRFVTRDPSGYGGGINLYSYVQNNPGNLDDPMGLCGGDDAEPGFWDAVTSGLNVGLKATASALSFNLYDGGDAKCDPDFGTSKTLAGVGRDAAIMAATLGTGGPVVAEDEGAGVLEDAAEGADEPIDDGCPGGLRCFTGDAPVQMADGTTRRIADVQVGDKIKSRNPLTGLDDAKTVTATIKRFAPAVVTVSLADAKTGQTETLTCTPEHPFFVSGQGWVEAGSLGIGTSLVSRAGPALSVTGVTWHRDQSAELAAGIGSTPGGFTVYNLTVEDDHTFFVGTNGGGTWVHNIWCGAKLPSEAEARAAAEEKAGFSLDDVYPDQVELRPGSRSPMGDPGIRTEWEHPYTGAKVHLDPNGTYYGPGDSENIMAHYGVEVPGQATEHFTWQDLDEGTLSQNR